MLFVFEYVSEKVEAKSKAVASMFDDDDSDIFADLPSLSAAPPKAKREAKPKDTKKKASLASKNTDDIFGDLGAEGEDIFETRKKKKQPEKTVVNSDPLNLF